MKYTKEQTDREKRSIWKRSHWDRKTDIKISIRKIKLDTGQRSIWNYYERENNGKQVKAISRVNKIKRTHTLHVFFLGGR